VNTIAVIGGIPVERDGLSFRWVGGLRIDGDGAPDCYHPDGKSGRDFLANAGKPGNWWGLVTVADQPVVQGPRDPCPGFYVSPTSLVDRGKAITDPRRYVNSNAVPYLAVPPELRTLGVGLGDVAWVEYRGHGCAAIVADTGPRGKLGEGSIALARQLGIPESPRHGGTGAGVAVTLWPGTSHGWPREAVDIDAQVAALRTGTATV
jgi:hypothetical protein